RQHESQDISKNKFIFKKVYTSHFEDPIGLKAFTIVLMSGMTILIKDFSIKSVANFFHSTNKTRKESQLVLE
ncbi:unnamed protein product, partial [Sphenostylis stenocarpa]